jgi:hypothetical protein
VDPWTGHRPATKEALLAAFDRVAASSAGLSRSEIALLTACEARAAAANGEFAKRLSTEDGTTLLDAAGAFRIAGAVHVADEVVRVAQQCQVAPNARARRARLKSLERRLTDLGDEIDAILATYALRILRADREAMPLEARRGPISAPRTN